MTTNKIEGFVLGMVCFILTIGICIQIRTINNNGGITDGCSEKSTDGKS